MKRTFILSLLLLAYLTSAHAINGTGSQEEPYQIGNVDELYEFAAIVNGTHDSIEKNIYAYGVLTDNITLNENLIDEAGNLSNPEPRIWTQLDQYHGVLDGQFHVIRGLYAVTPAGSSISLRTGFIRKFNNGTVKNLGFEDAFIKSVHGCVGGICGDLCSGSILNCYFIGAIESNTTRIGGISSYCNKSGTISNCYTICKITAQKDMNGICALNEGGTIENCYTMSIDEPSDSEIRQRFENGEIAFLLQKGKEEKIWGQSLYDEKQPVLAGETVYKNHESGLYSNTKEENAEHIFDNCICNVCGIRNDNCTCKHEIKNCQCIICGETIHDFDNCYCKVCKTKEEGCTNHIHELDKKCQCIWCGEFNHDFDNCYCKVCKTKKDNCSDHNHELDPNCQCVWCGESVHDFDNCYCKVCQAKEKLCTNHIHVYNNHICICGNTDTDFTSYEIYTVDDLYQFLNLVQEGQSELNAKLMNDIIVNDVDWDTYDSLSIDDLKKLDIRIWQEYESEYHGIFDGQGHIISGLYFHTVGLFNELVGATIKNLGLENCRGKIEVFDFFGAICTAAWNSNFTQCHVSGKLESEELSCSGLVGRAMNCEFTDCYNLASIKSFYCVAGITTPQGRDCELAFTNCWNAGKLLEAWCMGGILGCSNSGVNSYDAILTNCYNIGDMENESFEEAEISSGGLVGIGISMRNLYLNNCYNYGQIHSLNNQCFSGHLVANPYNIVHFYNYDGKSTVQHEEEYFNVNFHNCYYLDSCLVEVPVPEYMITEEIECNHTYPDILDLHAMSAEQFANGEVCYRLNEGVTDGSQPYYQNLSNVSLRSSNIDIDAYPILDTTHRAVFTDGETYFNYGRATESPKLFVQGDSPIIYTQSHTIFVGNTDGRVVLSDMNGKIIFSKKVENKGIGTFEEILLEKEGAYLLVINNRAYKVIIK